MLNNTQKTIGFVLAVPLVVMVNVSESWASVSSGRNHQLTVNTMTLNESGNFSSNVDTLGVKEKLPSSVSTRPSRQTQECRLLGDC